MQPITQCSREERMERALMAIEAMTTQFGEGVPEDFTTVTPEEMSRFVSAVFKISHAAPGRCGNPHHDWLAKIEEVEADGKKRKLYDPEEGMRRSHDNADGVPPNEITPRSGGVGLADATGP